MANEKIGRLDTLLLAKEATAWSVWTTFVSIPLTEAPYIKPVVEYFDNESGLWRIEAWAWKCLTKNMSETTLTGNAYPKTFWHILTALFWQSTAPATIETSVYKHSFTILNSNNHKTYSVCTDWLDQKLSLYNMLDSFSLNAEVWGVINYTAMFKWKAEATTTWKTVTFVSEECMKVSWMSVKFADSISWLTAASVIPVTSLNFECSKNVLDLFETWSIEPTSFHNQDFRTTWDMELIYRDDTYKAYNTAWTTKSMRITIIGTTLIGATKYNELSFDFALLNFDEWDRSNDNDGITTQTLWFTASYWITEASMMTWYIQNWQATQY